MGHLNFFATVENGIEDLASAEVERLLCVKCEPDVGKVFFCAPLESVYTLNLSSSMLNKIMICMCRSNFDSLHQIYSLVRQVDFSEYILPNQSFAVESERFGVHNFTSVDVSRVVGQAIIDSYLSCKNIRLKVNLEEPDVKFFSLVRDKEFIFGLNTTGYSLHRRGYRVYEHPAALKPTLASAMLELAEWDYGKALIDPMCGSATIPIEAAFKARNIPPNYLRIDFAFAKLNFFDSSVYEVFRENFLKQSNDGIYRIFGIEKFEHHLQGAKINCTKAGVSDTVFLNLGDALDYRTYPQESFSTFVTNPPYGLRMTLKHGLKRFYSIFLKTLKDHFSGSTLILITAAYRKFVSALEEVGLNVLEERSVLHGDLKAKIFKCRI